MADRRGVRIALATGVLALLAAVVLLSRSRGPMLAPDFAVPDLDGHTVRLSALRGKVVLVNLWATWCPPCREEMPSMQQLWSRFHERDFELLAVSQDEDGAERVAEFVHEMKLSFPVLVDPQREVGDRYGVWGYPETFVIDRNGYVVERVIGPRDWTAPAEVTKLEALLAGATAGAPSRTLGLAPKASEG